jgi:hypothetical protein
MIQALQSKQIIPRKHDLLISHLQMNILKHQAMNALQAPDYWKYQKVIRIKTLECSATARNPAV